MTLNTVITNYTSILQSYLPGCSLDNDFLSQLSVIQVNIGESIIPQITGLEGIFLLVDGSIRELVDVSSGQIFTLARHQYPFIVSSPELYLSFSDRLLTASSPATIVFLPISLFQCLPIDTLSFLSSITSAFDLWSIYTYTKPSTSSITLSTWR